MTKPVHFFLVDDDKDDTLIFKEVLEDVDSSIDFKCAADGEEALDVIKHDKGYTPDVIFLDLNMPRMGGKECLTAIKKDEKLQRIPVIMYTTSSQSKDIEETMQNGAICFITKPTDMHELKNILASVAQNVHGNLEKSLRTLSDTSSTFIVC